MTQYNVGDRIRDFIVDDRLGSGGFGTVYACRWEIDGRAYAVKVVQGTVEEARREYLALQRVHHPNIVGCIHAGRVDDQHWYLQCELVEGSSLEAVVDGGVRLPVWEAADIGAQLLDALEAIHPDIGRIHELEQLDELTNEQLAELDELKRSGLVHRDVKPANVILTPEGRVVLVDFGIASAAWSTVRTMASTPDYVPPDSMRIPGDRWNPDVDLYAAGVVLYELLCGEHPYSDAEYGAEPNPPPDDLPSGLRAWLTRACAPRSRERFGTAAEMREALLVAAQEAQQVEEDFDTPLPLLPYVVWEPLQPFADTNADIVAQLCDVVEVEGPILCGRLYRLVADQLGTNEFMIRQRMNRLTYGAIREGRIRQVEPIGGGQLDKTVYPRDAGEFRARQLGPRPIQDYPAVEMQALVRQAMGLDSGLAADEERLVDEVGKALGVDVNAWDGRSLRLAIRSAVSALAGTLGL